MITNTMIAKANAAVEILISKGYKVEVTTINKNGVEKLGISIGEGNVRSVLYPDYDKSIENIVQYVIDGYNYSKTVTSQDVLTNIANEFADFDRIKDMIVPYLTKAIIPEVATHTYLDLNVYYRMVNGDYSILIKNEHLRHWGITEEQLFLKAKDNIKNKILIEDMVDILPAPLTMGMERGIMRVATTKDKRYGSSTLLLTELLEEKSNGKDLFILPSSIHEVIIIDAGNNDAKELADIITAVNSSQLKAEEVMSDHPYLYSHGEIKEA